MLLLYAFVFVIVIQKMFVIVKNLTLLSADYSCCRPYYISVGSISSVVGESVGDRSGLGDRCTTIPIKHSAVS